ncbi:DUF1845 domain-containing protein [Thiocystis minor]|uniref:DUF1845 domain-containing protein n=1 Tax=Thiocystis minor TaxID=61597 RepID=UPI001F5CCE54|nr:DUF1845 domain-containing protein [Thiocystis minor]
MPSEFSEKMAPMAVDHLPTLASRHRASLAQPAPVSRRAARPYRHSRPVFDRAVRIHSEYVRRLVSDRQLKPAMTALYGIDVILRLIATEAQADQIESVIEARLIELSEAMTAERERLQRELERHGLMEVRPRYTHPTDLRIQVASPHIGAYTNLIVELDQMMIAIDTLWLSGLLSNKAHAEREIQWRNQLGQAGQRFIALHRLAYAEAERQGQREAVDREAHEVLTVLGEDDTASADLDQETEDD